ncbi:hypothetical protein GGR52DRAFT_568162 [Hypoxylon sp. FL1284]|nr:hypothetical protein GGR52DRAFT_568162 [Hypoxylon sp. FL1284]
MSYYQPFVYDPIMFKYQEDQWEEDQRYQFQPPIGGGLPLHLCPLKPSRDGAAKHAAYLREQERLKEEEWARFVKPLPRLTPAEEEERARQARLEQQRREEELLRGLIPWAMRKWRKLSPRLRLLRPDLRPRVATARADAVARYRAAAFALDARLYWAGRWYRERSPFPELFYILRLAARWLLVLAGVVLLAYLAAVRVRAYLDRPRPVVVFTDEYARFVMERARSVSKPCCECPTTGAGN